MTPMDWSHERREMRCSVSAPGHSQHGQKRVHIVLVGFGVVSVTDIARHREAHGKQSTEIRKMVPDGADRVGVH
jgi:hypothetical protein